MCLICFYKIAHKCVKIHLSCVMLILLSAVNGWITAEPVLIASRLSCMSRLKWRLMADVKQVYLHCTAMQRHLILP